METQAVTNPKVSLLRPDQIGEMTGEREVLMRKMQNPNIQDKGQVADQLRRLDKQLETQRPKEFGASEIDNAVKREAQLRAEWTEGMLSQEEMRKAPPGAVDRHLQWERKNKPAISEWQNIMRRLNAGSDAREVASIERFRPTVNSMNLDNAIIQGKQFYLPPMDAATAVIFSESDLEVLRVERPDIAAMIGLMTNEQRSEAKKVLSAQGIFLTQAQRDGKRGAEVKREKKVMTPEHLAAMRAGRDAAREAKLAEKAA